MASKKIDRMKFKFLFLSFLEKELFKSFDQAQFFTIIPEIN